MMAPKGADRFNVSRLIASVAVGEVVKSDKPEPSWPRRSSAVCGSAEP